MENVIAREVVDASVEVHRFVGPGLLESAYQRLLLHELQFRGLKVDTEIPVPISYKGLRINAAYRMDLVVEGRVVVELKAVESINASHKAQLLSYIRLSGMKLGLLINFNASLMRDGITRLVNRL